MRIDKTYRFILVLFFLTIIYGLFFINIFKEPIPIDTSENRSLKTNPTLDINHLDAFPGEYDEYVNDQFVFRKELISSYNKFTLKHFQISPVPEKVLVGKDGWLFLSGRNLDTYLGRNLLNEKEIVSIEKEIEYRANYCNNRDIKFYFIIVPQKYTVYEEYLPVFLKNTIGHTLREQVVNQLRGNESINFIDLTEELINRKSKDLLYFKTDNHWNDLGAFYASSLIVNNIKKDFPAIQELKIEDYNLSRHPKAGGNLASMISKAEHFNDEKVTLDLNVPTNAKYGEKSNYEVSKGFPYPDLYETVTVNSDAPPIKMLMIRESFANYQIQFMQLPFRKTVYIWDSWHFGRNEEIIEMEKPDIVILQIYEPMLTNLITYGSSKTL